MQQVRIFTDDKSGRNQNNENLFMTFCFSETKQEMNEQVSACAWSREQEPKVCAAQQRLSLKIKRSDYLVAKGSLFHVHLCLHLQEWTNGEK